MSVKIKRLLISAWNNLTIEPVVIFCLTSFGLSTVTRANLLLDKACYVKLNYTEEICKNLTGDYLTEAEKVVTDYERTLNLAASGPRILFTLLAGPWSDKHGRKLLIMMPLIGQALATLTYILNVKFFFQLPFEALYMECINELTGNINVLYYLGVYSYMADITSPDERTARMGLLDGLDYVSTMLGTYISGPIYDQFGYYPVFASSCVSATLGSLYVFFRVKESKIIDTKKEESNTTYGTTEVVKSGENGYCSQIFNAIKVVFKPRSNGKRVMIWILLVTFACYNFAYVGTEGSHRYLYVKLEYNWDQEEFTTFLSAYKGCYLIALWILLPFASRILKLHDATTLIVACITGAIGWSLPAFINGQLWFILGFVLALFTPVTTVCTRTLISRCVSPDEVGSIFALISVISAIASSLITAAYQAIYKATLETFPSTFLLINASLLLVTIPTNLFLRKKLR